jgi:hypothetical protein
MTNIKNILCPKSNVIYSKKIYYGEEIPKIEFPKTSLQTQESCNYCTVLTILWLFVLFIIEKIKSRNEIKSKKE